MAWRRTGDKPLPEPMLTQFTALPVVTGHIYLCPLRVSLMPARSCWHISSNDKTWFNWQVILVGLIYDWWSMNEPFASMGPFYWHGLTLIPAWISNCIHYKVWDEINYPFSFNGCNRWSLGTDKSFHHTLHWAYDYLSILGLKLNHVSKKDPVCTCMVVHL